MSDDFVGVVIGGVIALVGYVVGRCVVRYR